MTRVIVTGASGFIGSQVAMFLLNHGVDVVSIGRTKPHFAVKHLKHDLLSVDNLLVEYLRGADIVIHMAAVASAASHLDVEDINVRLTESIYRASKLASVRSFVLLSSIKAVAENSCLNGPLDVSVAPEPRDAYGRSKLACENIVKSVDDQNDMAVTIIRSPLVYGPGVKGNFRTLIKLASLPVPLPLAGLKGKRSLLYVGNLSSLLYSISVGGPLPGIYHVSDGRDVSTSELLSIIRVHLGNKSRLFYFPTFIFKGVLMLLRRGEYFDKLFSELRISNVELEKKFGWEPLYSLDQGLKLTLKSKR